MKRTVSVRTFTSLFHYYYTFMKAGYLVLNSSFFLNIHIPTYISYLMFVVRRDGYRCDVYLYTTRVMIPMMMIVMMKKLLFSSCFSLMSIDRCRTIIFERTEIVSSTNFYIAILLRLKEFLI